MVRVYHRVGRRSAISAPLWLAVVGYVVWASVAFALLLLVAGVVVAAGLLYLLALAAGRVTIGARRRLR